MSPVEDLLKNSPIRQNHKNMTYFKVSTSSTPLHRANGYDC